jgi:signal transduction histidine kinase/CheY-like chemotaxis protein
MLTVGRLILSELAPVVSAQHAVFYTYEKSENNPYLTLLASYAYEHPGDVGKRLELGQGLVGQCALENKKLLLTNLPPDYIRVTSGLGSSAPVNVIVLPVMFEGEVKAVLELASFERFSPTHQAFLDQLTESIGIVLNTIEANMRTENLLKQSQSLARELGSRQEELQQTNQELQEKAKLLAFQNVEVERKNAEVEQARQALEEKAEQLALTSKYKSEFLANMSHELRTPLNSLLILSDQLSKNPDGNLSAKQTEYAKTIHSSGNDLLMLINDILDLSKIESGTVVLDVGELRFTDLHGYVERTFRHVAEAKGVDFGVALDPNLPRSVSTDSKRLQQVIKNLLSNAFKFTHKGEVRLRVEEAHDGWHPDNESLNAADCVVALSVSDTGIGIPAEKQQIIFEAFQQADGSTSRKYGGTGLGLAISREIARLLGGEIGLVSRQGVGSTFTLYMPQNFVPQKSIRRAALPPTLDPPHSRTIEQARQNATEYVAATESFGILSEPTDDRNDIQSDDHVVLIVDNDQAFANIELDVARKAGFKGITTPSGAAAIALAQEFMPDAVMLDISLPDIDGWRVLKRLKDDLSLRHIPVYVVSTIDRPERGYRLGAEGVLAKPIQTEDALEAFIDGIRRDVERDGRRIVVFEPDVERREQFCELLAGDDVTITVVDDGEQIFDALAQGADLVIAAPQLPDMSLAVLAERLSSEPPERSCPLLVSTAGRTAKDESPHWARLADEFHLRLVDTPESLVDEAALLLCRPLVDLAEPARRLVQHRHDPATLLKNKKVLIVDDDIRNIFALTSVLERYDVATVPAETGREAIRLLQTTPDVDIVLMDIMMPEIDGNDTTRAIRQMPQFRNLPIVAVTAKAMVGDREKCLEAGAWDYLSKPVDPEKMLGVLRAWLAT